MRVGGGGGGSNKKNNRMRALIFRFTCCAVSVSFLPFSRYEINVYTLLLPFLSSKEINEFVVVENIHNVHKSTDNLISFV
jgi:hypothetical protein